MCATYWTLVNKITQSLDTGGMVYKKAFATVNHKVLVTKLYSYGIRGQLINWFKSQRFSYQIILI